MDAKITQDKQPKIKQAPDWFRDFEVRNNARLDGIENRLSSLETKIDNLDDRVE